MRRIRIDDATLCPFNYMFVTCAKCTLAGGWQRKFMQRIQYHRYGGPGEMRLEEVELPKPGRGEVRVRVIAAAANPADWKVSI